LTLGSSLRAPFFGARTASSDSCFKEDILNNHAASRPPTLPSGTSARKVDPEQWFDQLPLLAAQFLAEHRRPLVTVSYAQSVDGSIATRNRNSFA
jgi:hypothetical protein